jgi:hypothetical protein
MHSCQHAPSRAMCLAALHAPESLPASRGLCICTCMLQPHHCLPVEPAPCMPVHPTNPYSSRMCPIACDMQVRKYPPQIRASCTIPSGMDAAMSPAFRTIAGEQVAARSPCLGTVSCMHACHVRSRLPAGPPCAQPNITAGFRPTIPTLSASRTPPVVVQHCYLHPQLLSQHLMP